MAVAVTLRYLTEPLPVGMAIAGRPPESVKVAMGKNAPQHVIEAVKPAALATGYAQVVAACQMAVAGAA